MTDSKLTSNQVACHYCRSSEKELRPYGPAGESVCFDCAMLTPKRKRDTERAFEMQMSAAGSVAVLSGHGPVPHATLGRKLS